MKTFQITEQNLKKIGLAIFEAHLVISEQNFGCSLVSLEKARNLIMKTAGFDDFDFIPKPKKKVSKKTKTR